MKSYLLLSLLFVCLSSMGIIHTTNDTNPAHQLEDSVNFYLNLSTIHFNNKEYQSALDHAQQALRIDSTQINSYIKISNCYIELGDDSLALVTLNQAINFNLQSSELYELRAKSNLNTLNLEDAYEDITQAIELEYENMDLHALRSYMYMLGGLIDYALVDINHVIHNDSTNAKAWALRGKIHSYNSNFRSAIEDYEHSLTIDPYDKSTHALLCYSLHEIESYNESITESLEYLKIDSLHVGVWHILASSYNGLLMKDEAIETYEKIQQLDSVYFKSLMDEIGIMYFNLAIKHPHFQKIYLQKANYIVNKCKTDGVLTPERLESLELMQKYVMVGIHGTDTYVNQFVNFTIKDNHNLYYRAQILEKQGLYKHMINDCNKILNSNPQYIPALDMSLRYALHTNHLVEALSIIDRMLLIDPRDEEKSLLKARILFYQSKNKEAKEINKRVIASTRKMENKALAYYQLADIDFQIKQYERAHRNIDYAIKHSPNDETYYYHKAHYHFVTKHYKQALAGLITALKLNPNNVDARSLRKSTCRILRKIDPKRKEYYNRILRIDQKY